jgi:hypothetical protein|tara:strand:+ start:17 stop:196 length:180 start_codon:yes stop_codon:yes gene_type:complete
MLEEIVEVRNDLRDVLTQFDCQGRDDGLALIDQDDMKVIEQAIEQLTLFAVHIEEGVDI